MPGRTLLRLVVGLAVAASVPLVAQAPMNVKLATLAPESSPWTSALRSMGAAWSKATASRVRLTVYAGTIPSESSAIARMAVDGLQAATLTAGGLAEIDEALNVFGIPFFFQSDAEVAYVQEKLTPLITQRLEAKKFHLINWGNAGWVQLFSKNPIRSITDLKRARLYTGEGSPKTVQWYTSNGFHVVPLSAGEIPKQLKLPTGAIDAAPSPPVFALTLQFFRDASYMLDIRIAPLTSATVMTDSAWNKISPDDRARMIEAAKAMEKQIEAQAPALDAKSINEMKAAGLQVITLDANALGAFQAAAESQLATQRGDMVPTDIFDAAVRARTAFRTSGGR
ncbi:MAG TPA: TRAP transporter substrate-binding protein DctP [Vicinamibacterales bacterium]